MADVIYKYKLEMPLCSHMMPRKAEILAVQKQGDDIVLWAQVDTQAKLEVRRFMCCVTGGNAPAGKHEYIGTVQLGDFVAHVYEVLS